MLMLDRIPYISAEGGAYDKGELRAELDTVRTKFFKLDTTAVFKGFGHFWRDAEENWRKVK